MRRRRRPESILPIVVMDSGLVLRTPRNDEYPLHPTPFRASIPACSRPSGRPERGVADHLDFAGEGRGAAARVGAVGGALRGHCAADPALGHRVAARRRRQPSALRRARREGTACRGPGRARTSRGDACGADPDPEIGGVVGADPGRAAAHLRRQVAPHRRQPEISARDRPAAVITAATSASPSIS